MERDEWKNLGLANVAEPSSSINEKDAR